MKCGSFGRESSTLLAITSSGALSCKILSRNTSLSPSSSNSKAPPEQDIPLKIPKKSKLYVEQVERERKNGTEMHRIFQRELYKMRLATARAYVAIISDPEGPLSFTNGTSIRLGAEVMGIGPVFRLQLSVENTGKRTLLNLPITFTYNAHLYQLDKGELTVRFIFSHLQVPVLVPGLIYRTDVRVECLRDSEGADVIRIIVCSPQPSSLPLITYSLSMPVSELFFDQ